ncbi:Serine/threonine-protein kinase PknF [Mycobacterium basiliense]|uniref:Serine/threonine-protein kinase PknF n=1 Tax=Mycobacterium basiliense TaxID=2094119 RepID=A0A447GGR0_9MYCO|nr:protein kinase [Mycobacterium basiliense]VDM89663.1 Serine/threonine-protein kinase PknF [Mycobacterium basiliense]
MPLATGAIFAGYHIIRLLGSGASGEVYLAQHPRLPRRDAVKIISPELMADLDFRERFAREAEAAATLFHPNIVAVHDRGEFDGRLWMAMSYVEGTDAARLVMEQHPAGMAIDDACEIVTAVADALDYANQRGLLHRDVKPANILLTNPQDGGRRIMLADFGIVRPLGDSGGLTVTNFAVGTMAYSAPEQLMGARIDGRADQYGLAATAFHLLTGAPPFVTANPLAIIEKHLNSGPPPLSDRRPELAHLDRLFAKALSKDPGNRFRRCREFAIALRQRGSVDSVDSAARRRTTPPRRPVRVPVFGADAARDPFEGIVAELADAGFLDAREVGRGAYGVVYRCVQPQNGRQVAVKVLTAVFDRDNYERFRREVFVMGRLSGHPNIAAILQVGALPGGRPYVVMPFYPGNSLETLVRNRGPCDWAWAIRVGVKLAGALETAHRAGILHRDVKPANILLTEFAEPQLTDFGISRIVGGYETGSGYITGSLAFTAPEVLAGAAVSAAADIYSLGATLFNLVAGRPAFERRLGEERVAQFLRITTHEPPILLGPEVPADLSALVKRVMARNPLARPATAAEVGELLRGVQHEHGLVPDDMAIPAETGGPATMVGPATLLPVGGQPSTGAVDIGCRYPANQWPPDRHLHTPLTSFVGRSSELDELAALLSSDVRLVTLTGPGGVGKTRLAMQLASQLEHTVPGGVWLVELGNLLEAEHLIEVIADALLLGEPTAQASNPTRELARRLHGTLGNRRALVVLDNCEHLIPACSPLIDQLLRAVAGLQLLVTSRQVLGIPGERVYVVAPLSVPDPAEVKDDPAILTRLMDHDAVRLFIDRAKAVLPDFSMTDEERLNVVRLCAQLGGMPLMIELAAARLPTFGVTTLLKIITDRFQLLSPESGTVVASSHRTLPALVDWSYQLLTPDEREIWLAISLFASEFDAESALELCAASARSAQDVHLILASLVDKSMVASNPCNGSHRYRLLVTLREYAAELLSESGSRRDLVKRYVDRYQRIADEFGRNWFGARQVELFNAVHDDRENLRAALVYCQGDDELAPACAQIITSLHYYWLASTTVTETRRWLAEVADSDLLAPAIRVRALWSAGFAAVIQNDLETAGRYASAARELAIELGDQSSEGYANLVLGMVAAGRRDVTVGLAAYDRALECHRAHGDAQGIVATISALITALPSSDDPKRGTRLWQEAVALCEQAGDRWQLAYLMFARGLFLYFAGDYERAAAAELQSLELSRPFADRIVAAFALEVLAWTAARSGDYELAARRLGAAAGSWSSGDVSVVRYGGLTFHRRAVDRLIHEHLGDERGTEMRAEGSVLGVDPLVAEALGYGD